jgi:chromosome segregation ATPase
MEISVKRVVVMAAAVAVAIGCLVGCARLPQAAVQETKVALDQARQAQAETYAPQAWAEAQQAMDAANAEIDNQRTNSALSRSYKKTAELLEVARKKATEAEKAAVAGKAQVRQQAEDLLTELTSGFEQANQLFEELSKCRRRPKGFASDLGQIRGEVNGLARQVPDLQSALEADSYMEVKTLATQLKSQLDAVVAEMEKTKARLGC